MAVRRARGASSPRAGRGQHFLRSRALAETLVDDAGAAAGDLVLDLGAGRGVLTAELVARGARVRAVELDSRLAGLLRARFADVPAVTVVEGDARALPPPREPFAVVANLPFAGATEILRRLLDDPRVPLLRAAVVLQWEAAAKLAAVWPSTLLGVHWGAWYELSVVRRFAPDAFAPPPAVAAGVLGIQRREEPLVPLATAAAFRGFVSRGFRHGVRSVVPRRALLRVGGELGFARSPQPRDVDARQWSVLFATVTSGSPDTVPPRHAPL